MTCGEVPQSFEDPYAELIMLVNTNRKISQAEITFLNFFLEF